MRFLFMPTLCCYQNSFLDVFPCTDPVCLFICSIFLDSIQHQDVKTKCVFSFIHPQVVQEKTPISRSKLRVVFNLDFACFFLLRTSGSIFASVLSKKKQPRDGIAKSAPCDVRLRVGKKREQDQGRLEKAALRGNLFFEFCSCFRDYGSSQTEDHDEEDLYAEALEDLALIECRISLRVCHIIYYYKPVCRNKLCDREELVTQKELRNKSS